jgi:2',3'-cyclic-nucleotide 2'-phosphodiesterase (5'-nucleotidase family)
LSTLTCAMLSLRFCQVVANHEWDRGLTALEQYLDSQTNKAVLGANIDFGGHGLQGKIRPYVVKNVKGRRVSPT